MLLLIEKRASESRSEMLAVLGKLAHETSDGSRESLDFDLWETRRFHGREFVRLVCQTGTAQQFVAQALTGNGIARDLLQGERINGQPVAWLISSGQKLSCNPFDIETICERCRGNAATNALSDLGPPGGATGQRMWHLCRSCENEFSAERDTFMQKFPPASRAEMSADQRHAAAANWRQEVNSHMTHWVLGDQPQ